MFLPSPAGHPWGLQRGGSSLSPGKPCSPGQSPPCLRIRWVHLPSSDSQGCAIPISWRHEGQDRPCFVPQHSLKKYKKRLQLLIHQACVCLSLDYAGKQYRSKKSELQLTNSSDANDTGIETKRKIDFSEKPDSYLALGANVLQREPQGCQWEADRPNNCSRCIFKVIISALKYEEVEDSS